MLKMFLVGEVGKDEELGVGLRTFYECTELNGSKICE